MMSNIRYPDGKLPSSRWKYVLINLIKGVVFLIMFVVGVGISANRLPSDGHIWI